MSEEAAKLSAEELAALIAKVPKNEDGVLTSIGSIKHEPEAATCKPCIFFATKKGCKSGIYCWHCHLGHKFKKRPRPCKGKRERTRKLLARLAAEDGTGGSQDSGDSQHSKLEGAAKPEGVAQVAQAKQGETRKRIPSEV